MKNKSHDRTITLLLDAFPVKLQIKSGWGELVVFVKQHQYAREGDGGGG